MLLSCVTVLQQTLCSVAAHSLRPFYADCKLRFVYLQREWAKATGDKDKVIGWPAHLFEQFVIVVRQYIWHGHNTTMHAVCTVRSHC